MAKKLLADQFVQKVLQGDYEDREVYAFSSAREANMAALKIKAQTDLRVTWISAQQFFVEIP